MDCEEFKNRYLKSDREFIGEGGFGIVFKTNVKGQKYAIKEIDKEKIRDKIDWQLECKIHMQLNHGNIVLMHDYSDFGSKVLLALEFCIDGDLAKYMKHRISGLQEDKAIHILRQLVDALTYLHIQMRIVHRDLSLANIFISDRTKLAVKIGDFGLAKCLPQINKIRPNQENPGTFCGNVDTMAPEVIQKRPTDFKVDIWALGCILFNLLLGRAAFRAEKKERMASIFERTLNGETVVDINSISNISNDAKDLIQRMICNNPRFRVDIQCVANHKLLAKRNNLLRSTASEDSGHYSGFSSRNIRRDRFYSDRVPHTKSSLPLGIRTTPLSCRNQYILNNNNNNYPMKPNYNGETPTGAPEKSLRRDASFCSKHSHCADKEMCSRSRPNERVRPRCASYVERGTCGGRCKVHAINSLQIEYQTSNKHSPSIDYASGGNAPHLPPFNTDRLKPDTLKTMKGMCRVLEGGDVCMEWTREKEGVLYVTEVMQISGHANTIAHYKPNPPVQFRHNYPVSISVAGLTSYTIETLPERLHRHYRYVCGGVDVFRSRRIVVSLFEAESRFDLIEDSSFQMTNKQIVITRKLEKDGSHKLKCLENGVSFMPSNEMRDNIERKFRYANEMKTLNIELNGFWPIACGTPISRGRSRQKNAFETPELRSPELPKGTFIPKFDCWVERNANGCTVKYKNGEIVEVNKTEQTVKHTNHNKVVKVYSAEDRENMPKCQELQEILQQWYIQMKAKRS